MAVFQIQTFKDIQDAVREELKVQSGDTNALNRIKRTINNIYLNEVVPYERWSWLRKHIDLVHGAKTTVGTANIIQNSRTVVLTVAPAFSQRGAWFSSKNHKERYRVAQHAAGATTLTLESEFTGSTNSAGTYTLWTDFVALPADCRETFEVTQDFWSEPLQNIGLQRYRGIVSVQPKTESRPKFYTTDDYVDPDPFGTIASLPSLTTRASAGLVKTLVFSSDVSALISVNDRIEVSSAGDKTYNGQFVVSSVTTTTITYTSNLQVTESAVADASLLVEKQSIETNVERSRRLLIYPARFDQKITLHIDYIVEPLPLENDDDEPLMPLNDRNVLVYGALMLLWRSIGRDSESANINLQLYDRKMTKMQGKLGDSSDFPKFRVDRTYLSSKRSSSRFRAPRITDSFTGGGGGSAQSVKGAANTVAIFDSGGELIGSSTVSTDELEYINDFIQKTLTTLVDNQAVAATIITFLSSDFDHAIFEYNLDRGTGNYEAGTITIKTDGTTVDFSQEIGPQAGTVGVTFDVSIAGGTVSLTYTSTSTGVAPELEHRIRRF